MVSTRSLFQVVPITMMLLAAVSCPAGAHAQSSLEFRSGTRLSQRCKNADPLPWERDPAGRFGQLFSGTRNPAMSELCDGPSSQENQAMANRAEVPPIPTHQIESSSGSGASPSALGSRLHVQPSIRASGKEAELIASASAEVLAILRNDNACSAWFAKTDPNVADTFASLQMWIERNGPEHIVQERGDNGNWIRHGPYIARTSESTGAGTNVAINANGAFFRDKAEVYRIQWQQGIQLSTNTWQNLHVGPYDGATAKAQVITLLHELAHVVGAIPSDGESPSGLNRSEENTEVILSHCKSAVESAAKHTVVELTQYSTK